MSIHRRPLTGNGNGQYTVIIKPGNTGLRLQITVLHVLSVKLILDYEFGPIESSFQVSPAGTIDYPLLGTLQVRGLTAAQLAGVFAMLEATGLDASYINDYGASLSLATSESIAAVIDEVYPSADNLVFIILGDAATIRDQVAQYGPVTEISITEPRFHP